SSSSVTSDGGPASLPPSEASPESSASADPVDAVPGFDDGSPALLSCSWGSVGSTLPVVDPPVSPVVEPVSPLVPEVDVDVDVDVPPSLAPVVSSPDVVSSPLVDPTGAVSRRSAHV